MKRLKIITEFIRNIFKRELAVLGFFALLLDLLLIALAAKNKLPLQMGDLVFISILALLIALYRPRWIFFLFVSAISLENIILAGGFLPVQLRPYQFLGAILAAAVIILAISNRLNFKLTKPILLDWLVFTLPIFSFLALINSPQKSATLKQDIIIISFAVLYFLARQFVRSRSDILKTAAFFLISFFSTAIFGFYQVVADKLGKNSFKVMFGRPNGTFQEADWLGVYLCFALAVFLAGLFYLDRTRNLGRGIKTAALCILYLFILSDFILLILTLSRSAWVGALALIVVFLFFNLFAEHRHRLFLSGKNFLQSLVTLALLLAVAVAIISWGHFSKFDIFDRARSAATSQQKITIACDNGNNVPVLIGDTSELSKYNCRYINLEEISYYQAQGKFVTETFRKDPNVKTRSEIFSESWKIIKNSPLTGVGYGTITEILGRDARGAGLNESNIFLQVWAGSGILGLVAFVVLIGYLFIFPFSRISPVCLLNKFFPCPIVRDKFEKSLFLFSVLGLIALIVPNLFNAGLFMGIFWLGLASLVSILKIID